MFPICADYTGPRRVSFASVVTVLGVAPDSEQSPDRVPVDLPDIPIHDPVCPDIPEEDDMDVSIEVSGVPVPVLPPPLGFERFSWPTADEGPGSDPSLFDFSAELPGWFPRGCVGQSGDPPILSVTPDDSVIANMSSSRDEPDTPSGTDNLPDALVEFSPPDVYRSHLLRLSPTFRTV